MTDKSSRLTKQLPGPSPLLVLDAEASLSLLFYSFRQVFLYSFYSSRNCDKKNTHAVSEPAEETVHSMFLADLGIFPLFIPAGCTDLVQPVDHLVGERLMYAMKQFYKFDLVEEL
jgi:hypothetical protein